MVVSLSNEGRAKLSKEEIAFSLENEQPGSPARGGAPSRRRFQEFPSILLRWRVMMWDVFYEDWEISFV